MHNLNLLSYNNISEDGKKGENGWKGRGSIDNQKWHMVDFEAVCEISYACAPFICVCYDDDLVPSVYELRRELVYVTFDSSGLREEEVADHSNIIRHPD